MKVYFTASSQEKAVNRRIYERIVAFLQREHEVFEKVLSEHLPPLPDISAHTVKQWYQEWSSYIQACDCALVEGSYPSTVHIGFETGAILSKGKPVILVHKQGKDPVFINNFHSSRLVKSEYTEDNLEEVLVWCLDEVKQMSNRRFTFFISPRIDAFLEKIAKRQSVSRAEFIRNLIEREMGSS